MFLGRRLLVFLPLFTILTLSFVALPMASAQQQNYHGDGATNNGNGGWTTTSAASDQCLNCHTAAFSGAPDATSYLNTGHKNMLRKVTAAKPWAGADGIIYQTTDDHYLSGSIYDWTGGSIKVGQCVPYSNLLQLGLWPNDPDCSYPYYGTTRNLFYLFGGWSDKTQLNTIFDSGFTGEQYPNGNYDCARCHTTGYRFDANGPEPSYKGAKIPDSLFSRYPTDFTSGTSSWALDGVQCERCHNADNGIVNHAASGISLGAIPSIPRAQAGIAKCVECHREESVDTTANTINVGTTLPNGGYSYLIVSDAGYCADGVSPDYPSCLGAASSWVYTPFFDHESGPTFLNSPHARFNGMLVQNQQNSPDLSVGMSGSFTSKFKEMTGENSGCTGCHVVHQSLVVAGTTPFQKTCADCHALSQNILNTTNHPTGPGTPFPTGTSADNPGSCITCHMSQSYHLLRISTDVNYRTFPTSAQMYDALNPVSTPNVAPDGQLSTAVWSDIDLACGQCHVGGDGVTNPYGLSVPASSSNAPPMSKAHLASVIANMHGTDIPRAAEAPLFNPTPGNFTRPQSVYLSDITGGVAIYYTLDGTTPTTSSTRYTSPISLSAGPVTINAIAAGNGYSSSGVSTGVYTFSAAAPTFSPSPSVTYSVSRSVTLADATPGATIYYTTNGSTPTKLSKRYTSPIPLSTTTTINAIAAANGMGPSTVASATYTFVAAAPTFSPSPSVTYSTPRSVTLSDATPGVTIYYTTDGSTPTTSSTVYAAPILISSPTTINAIASGAGFAFSTVSTATYTFGAAVPTFSPSPSISYSVPRSVTLSDATPGVTIYYTTDGSTPTTSSTPYATPILVSNGPTTIKAIAAAPGFAASSVASATYTFTAAAPTFSPSSSITYTGSCTVTFSDVSPGVTIYYTTDGTTPTTSSTPYTAPILLSVTTTIKAIAAETGYSPSSVASATYNIK